jgi:ATP-dependent Lon protease
MIMPAANKKDLFEIPKKVLREIEFIYVEDVKEVFREAMTGPLVRAAKAGAKKQAPKKPGKKAGKA